jgi:hypothetical protein
MLEDICKYVRKLYRGRVCAGVSGPSIQQHLTPFSSQNPLRPSSNRQAAVLDVAAHYRASSQHCSAYQAQTSACAGLWERRCVLAPSGCLQGLTALCLCALCQQDDSCPAASKKQADLYRQQCPGPATLPSSTAASPSERCAPKERAEKQEHVLLLLCSGGRLAGHSQASCLRGQQVKGAI